MNKINKEQKIAIVLGKFMMDINTLLNFIADWHINQGISDECLYVIAEIKNINKDILEKIKDKYGNKYWKSGDYIIYSNVYITGSTYISFSVFDKDGKKDSIFGEKVMNILSNENM